MSRPGLTVSPEAMKQMNIQVVRLETEARMLLLSIQNLNLSQRKKLLQESIQIIDKLDEFFVSYFEQWTPWHYISGSNVALEELNKLKMHIIEGSITIADQQAMQLIADDAIDNLRNGLTVFQKNISKIINDATRANIKQFMASDLIVNADRLKTTQLLKQSLKDQGLFVLRDRGGKKWSLDAYSDMLTRTELANASREGRGNRYVQNGQDLIQIDGYGSDHKACRRWEFKVVSLTGATHGFPMLDDAIANGLFHPNCKHNYNAYNSELVNL